MLIRQPMYYNREPGSVAHVHPCDLFASHPAFQWLLMPAAVPVFCLASAPARYMSRKGRDIKATKQKTCAKVHSRAPHDVIIVV